MVSLSNDPTTCIGNVPQLFLMDDAVSVRGDAVDAVGSNLYDDNYSPSSEHDTDSEPRGMEDSSWCYILLHYCTINYTL